MDQNNQNNQQNSNPTTNNTTSPQNAAPAQQRPMNNPPKPAPMAPQNKKNLYISGGVILVVLILLIAVPNLKGTKKSADTSDNVKTEDTDAAGCQPGFKFNIKTGKPCPADTGASKSDSGSVRGTETQSRASAIAAYAGKSITIGDDCSVTPATQNQPKNATILINNDSSVSHRITIGPKAYTVSGMHYTLSWLNLAPGTLKITCDGKDTKATVDII